MRKLLLAAAAGAAMSASSLAYAGTIDVTHYSVPVGLTEEISYSGHPGFHEDAIAGQIILDTHSTSGNSTVAVWCTDIFNDLATGNFSQGLLTTNRDGIGLVLTSTQIGEIGGLINVGDALLSSGHPTAGYTENEVSAAIQNAIWEVEIGPDFSFSSSDHKLKGLVNTYVTDITDGTFALDADVLQYTDGNYSQGVSATYTPPPSPVPEPASILLLGMGVLGLAAMRRRRA